MTPSEYSKYTEDKIAELKGLSKHEVSKFIADTFGGRIKNNPNDVIGKWFDQARGIQRHFSNIPQNAIDIQTTQDALATLGPIQTLSQAVSNYVFGGKNIDDYLCAHPNTRVGDIKLPDSRDENIPTYLSPEKQKEMTSNPIIPICRKDNSLILLGKDAKTQGSLVYVMGLPDEQGFVKGYQNSEMPLYVYVGGVQPKYMGRVSYKPDLSQGGAHEQASIVNGKLVFDKDGNLQTETVHTENVHFHSYLSDESGNIGTTLINPRHYTSPIKKEDNDYLPKNEVTCQNAMLSMLNKFNVLTPQLHADASVTSEDRDLLPLSEDLTSGAAYSLGFTDPEDVDSIPLNTQFYDALLPYYQNFVETGERDYGEEIVEIMLAEPSPEIKPTDVKIVAQSDDVCQN